MVVGHWFWFLVIIIGQKRVRPTNPTNEPR